MTKKEENGVQQIVGVRCKPFDYSSKEILTIAQYEKRISQEIDRVKALSSDKHYIWVSDPRRQDPQVWMLDPVRHLKGVGKTIESKLNDLGISTVQQISTLSDEEIYRFNIETGLSVARMQKIRAESLKAVPGACSYQKIDYRKTPNPYLAKYGANWRTKISSVTSMRKCVCIKELVQHIDSATKDVFRGTEYAESCPWSHDALSQLMDNDCKDWMKEKGYFDRWLGPVLGCNDIVTIPGQPEKVSTRYKERPPGNSPEVMPNDNSLNRDLKCAHDLCVSLTHHLPNSDPRKFSKSTPREISRGILRLFDPDTGCSPKPARIVQDISRVPDALKKIVLFGGGIVPGLADRNGIRRTDKRQRRYVPPKEEPTMKTFCEMGIHPDVVEVARELVESEKEKFLKATTSTNK